MDLNGGDLKYFYKEPSHHFWIDDNELMDNGWHINPEDNKNTLGYYKFYDDGTGKAKDIYFEAPNGHITLHKTGIGFSQTHTALTDMFIYTCIIFQQKRLFL